MAKPNEAKCRATVDQYNEDPLWRAAEAAEYLGLGRFRNPGAIVRGLVRRRRLRGVMLAGKVMVRKSWCDEYIARNTREPVYA